jgi:predicted ester cyclase
MKGKYLVSTEQNKTIVNRLVEEGINKGNLSLFDELFTPDAVDHLLPPGMPSGAAGNKLFFSMFRAAFPDLRFTIEDVIAEGDYVVQRVTGHGTMKGEFMGMPPTGKHATWSEIDIVRMKNGKIAEHWGNGDQMGMLQQLGLAPMPA